MSLQTATIQLPQTVYRRLERVALRQKRSVVHVVESAIQLLGTFEGIPAHEMRELDVLPYLSDDSLWALAQRVLTAEQHMEWEQLNDRLQRTGSLSEAEHNRRDELLALYDYSVLRRAVALRLLQQRGKDISQLLVVPER